MANTVSSLKLSQRRCAKCGRLYRETEYYKAKGSSDVCPDGFLPICKQCCEMTFKTTNPHSFMPYLYILDIPWVPELYLEVCLKVFQKGSTRLDDLSIFGRYVAKMKLRPRIEYGFMDSDDLQLTIDSSGEIDSIDNYDYKRDITQDIMLPPAPPSFTSKSFFSKIFTTTGRNNAVLYKVKATDKGGSAIIEAPLLSQRPDELLSPEELQQKHDSELLLAQAAAEASNVPAGVNPALTATTYLGGAPLSFTGATAQAPPKLSEEELTYLTSVWSPAYSIDQLLKLEKLYLEMLEDFDIRTSVHKTNARKICTLSLRIDECLAIQDYDGAKKAGDLYEKLTKASNLQPIQNKEGQESFLDSAGVLVRMCEEEGFIPKYVLDDSVQKDIVDLTIRDTQLYLRRLIDNDSSIFQRFEQEAEALINKLNEEEELEENDTDEVFEMLHSIDNLIEEEKALEEIEKEKAQDDSAQ